MKPNTYPIIDLHTDYVLACYEKGEKFGSTKQINRKMLERNKMKVILAGFSYDDLFKDTDLQLSVLLNETSKHNRLKLIKTRKDLEESVKKTDTTGVIIHLEGAGILGNNINRIHEFYKKGVRSIGLTHSVKNSLASGNKESPKDPLTPLGRKVVEEVVKKGMILDLAHLNEAGFWEVLSMTSDPVLVSHACTHKHCPDPRNLTDDQIKAVAERKGVIGIFFSSKYVKNSGKKVVMNDLLKHFTHIAHVGGVETVAIGSDFGGITTGLPKDLESVDKFAYLFSELKKAGFSNQEIEMIAYKNALRVLLQVLK